MSISVIVQLYNEWRRYQAGKRALYQLDDRMLRDIGINRTQIPTAARSGLAR